jgi:serine/threonine protein phosphatase PrpC
MSLEPSFPPYVYDPLPEKFSLRSLFFHESPRIQGYVYLKQENYPAAMQAFIAALNNTEDLMQHSSRSLLLKRTFVQTWNFLTHSFSTNDIYMDPQKIHDKACEILGYCRDRRIRFNFDKIHKSLTSKIHSEDRFCFDLLHKEFNIPPCQITYYQEKLGPWRCCRAETAGQDLGKKMEDFTSCMKTEWPNLGIDKTPVYQFALFDGHSGTGSALWLRENLHKYIEHEMETLVLYATKHIDELKTLEKKNFLTVDDWIIWHALKLAFVRAADDWRKNPNYDHSGTTATVLFIVGDSAWVANVGDSRTILAGPHKARSLSQDAKLDNSDFERSLLKRGGKVQCVKEVLRLDGKLAMARAFGDFGCKGITSRPKIKKICWKKQEKSTTSRYFILASDGLWDVIENAEIPKVINNTSSSSSRMKTISRILIEKALRRKSFDNISVVVVEIPIKKPIERVGTSTSLIAKVREK